MDKLLKGLHQFQTGYFSSHKELFEQLSLGQQPRLLFITCSDSRIDPNLITQAQVGELFVIRNAGNIVPPYASSNGGEGASIEYAIEALGIDQIIVCGHFHCGAMKGLWKRDSLIDKMPLVYDWLKFCEPTKRLVAENYSDYQGEELLDITIEENVLNQLENLHTYPVIRAKLHSGKLSLHGWVYRIETGEILAYDPLEHNFMPPHSRLLHTEHEYSLHHKRPVPGGAPFKITHSSETNSQESPTTSEYVESHGNSNSHASFLSPQQLDRIYRGSKR